MNSVDPTELSVARLSRLLLSRVGLRPASEGQIGLRLALSARLETIGERDALAYVERLERGDEDELRALLPLVTVGKTDFFRDSNQFRALRARVFPEILAQSRREGRPIRIWSAGCATGEEPYSLAMLAVDLGIEPSGLDLLATDVNPVAVEKAQIGRFPARRLSTLPPGYLERFFVADGEDYVAREELRRYLRLSVHNLAGIYYPPPLDGGKWDIVLCRNVIIYFDRPTTSRVVGRFFDGLREGGFLCLGYSESLYRISNAFDLMEIEGSFLYRRPAPRASAPAPRMPPAEERVARLRRAVEEHRVPRPPDQVRPAPERPIKPVAPPPGLVAPVVRAEKAPSTLSVEDPMQQAARLLEQGEFEKALASLDDSLSRSPGSLALMITRGNVLTVMGHQAEARRVYQDVLAVEPLCAEAHLFLGIACYESGTAFDAEGVQELTRAIFLDPSLGLAHYYAGRIAERRGDLAGARRAYRNAVSVCQGKSGWAPFLGHFPDLPSDPGVVGRAARYALAALEELQPA